MKNYDLGVENGALMACGLQGQHFQYLFYSYGLLLYMDLLSTSDINLSAVSILTYFLLVLNIDTRR